MTKTTTKLVAATGVLLLLAGAGTLAIFQKARAKPALTPQGELRAEVWPKERKLEAERIKSRQAIDETHGATPINLGPHINTQLSEGPLGWKGNDEDNLSELPKGKHIYAGVPFQVVGSIQLMGGWLNHYSKTYPLQVTNISIGRKCAKLHLLHGNGFITQTNFGAVVSKLVLHYTDASTRELELVAGKQAFDWWAPLFKTGVPSSYLQPAPGTERAWTGTNPYIQRWQPDLSVVLYKSTFPNPQPEVELASVDFVSTGTITCPFLVGLTVE